ncbi:MAG: hypothetical protein MZV65_39440 [Chromatiales bacterium]|nr:hypothetical protein [Chromatiales bacterium]
MNSILAHLVSTLITQLAPDVARIVTKAVLDVVEKVIVESPNKVDDKLLPLVRAIRETYDLEHG